MPKTAGRRVISNVSAISAETNRQRALCDWIGASIVGCDKMVPLGRHSSFSPPQMPLHETYTTSRMCDAAWWAPAAILGNIDHAWLFGYGDETREPWGFVTEPYLSFHHAVDVMEAAKLKTEKWGINYSVLSADRSSWNPGHCPPIIVSLETGAIRRFVRCATAWMLRP